MHTTKKIPAVLTIAGSDCSGGAGIQADIKTMTMLGVYAMSAITALTAQNTQQVTGILPVPPAFLAEQLEAIFTDIRPQAVKIGMVADPELIHIIAQTLEKYQAEHIVIDPVMAASSGTQLQRSATIHALTSELRPLGPRLRLSAAVNLPALCPYAGSACAPASSRHSR